MRVAWLAPFNLRLLRHRLPELRRHFHPAPWITNGASAISATGEVELHVVTYNKDVKQDYEFQEENIWFHVLRARVPIVPRALVLFQLDLPVFRSALRRIDPDVVHGHGTENIFSLAAVLSERPNVVSMQTVMAELVKTHPLLSRVRLHQTILRTLERETLRRASRVLVEAPFVADMVKGVNSRTSTTVLGNIASQEFFAISTAPGSRGNRVMFVGSLIETKGAAEAILAFHRVTAAWPQLELHVIGDGSGAYIRRLRLLAANGAGAHRIHLRGFLSAVEIAREYETTAMVVAPTYYDSSPNVISEALVAGVPVIASAVGGIPYMLDEGKAGQLVPPRDPASLADAIELVMRDPAEASAAARRGQQLARHRYSAETFVSTVMGVYREACDSRASASG